MTYLNVEVECDNCQTTRNVRVPMSAAFASNIMGVHNTFRLPLGWNRLGYGYDLVYCGATPCVEALLHDSDHARTQMEDRSGH